jgi:molybdenum cofactor guanylyltransferase
MTSPSLPREDITAVILAGGKATRMQGKDKGLTELLGRPLLDYIIAALHPQVDTILVNANRNLERYREFGYPVIEDILDNYCGPLAGMASAMQAAATPLLLTVPCDSPFVPAHLAETLYRSMAEADAGISVAYDGNRMQPVHALLRCALLPDLLDSLGNGERKVHAWYAQHRPALADFSASPEVFLNLNTPQDQRLLEAMLAAGEANV